MIPSHGIQDRLGPLQHGGPKIWEWRHDEPNGQLLQLSMSTQTMTSYSRSTQTRYYNRANRWERTTPAIPMVEVGRICSVKEVNATTVAITSSTAPASAWETPTHFLDVLAEWGETWMWDSLQMIGDDDWLHLAIQEGTLLAVTDGSYIRELYPDICSASFVLECSRGRGRIIGDFADYSNAANAYRGELLGLLAIHLILLAVNKVDQQLQGQVKIYSDCLGALGSVAKLPPTSIPARCKHSDILKIILIHCRDLTFACEYLHVKAHQDDNARFSTLCRPAQLNCMVDFGAKRVIWKYDKTERPMQASLPLEPVAVFLGKEKMTTSTGPTIRFWAHRKLARTHFHKKKILLSHQFDQVDWVLIHAALQTVPRMFAIWACKQVHNIAGTNAFRAKFTPDLDPKCPSCGICDETCAHILHCCEEGRVQALVKSIDSLGDWMSQAGTDAGLQNAILEYCKGRGSRTMSDTTRNKGNRFIKMASSQDGIGWRRFMEGMVSKYIVQIQKAYYEVHGGRYDPKAWVQQLSIRLLEITHGQWLYRNVQVHDSMSGILATERKEKLQSEIETQIQLGGEGLEPEDRFLLEINLEDLETTSGETQEYWLMAILAAREATLLQENNSSDGAAQIT